MSSKRNDEFYESNSHRIIPDNFSVGFLKYHHGRFKVYDSTRKARDRLDHGAITKVRLLCSDLLGKSL